MGFDSPPKQQPQMQRAIREVILDSTVATNSKGGLDVSLKATKTANDKELWVQILLLVIAM